MHGKLQILRPVRLVPHRREGISFTEPEDLLHEAKQAEAYGAERFGIVTSGRGQSDPVQFASIVKAVKLISQQTKLSVCCSLGLLTDDQLRQLKEAGCQRIHCNLETAKRYFPNICTTHTYEEKEDHIRRIQKAGLEVCSGGIMGLGETEDDRLDMAFALRSHHVTSVPLNIFSPIPGTPFGKINRPSRWMYSVCLPCTGSFCPM